MARGAKPPGGAPRRWSDLVVPVGAGLSAGFGASISFEHSPTPFQSVSLIMFALLTAALAWPAPSGDNKKMPNRSPSGGISGRIGAFPRTDCVIRESARLASSQTCDQVQVLRRASTPGWQQGWPRTLAGRSLPSWPYGFGFRAPRSTVASPHAQRWEQRADQHATPYVNIPT